MPESAQGRRTPSSSKGLTYADAGIDLDVYDDFIAGIDRMARRTYTPRVIPNPGGFAGLFRLDFNEKLFQRNYKNPVLVASTDGVGTKIKLAQQLGVLTTVGIDLVAMSVNDVIVEGAEPLFFLDSIAIDRADKRVLSDLLSGVVEGCRRADCALLGGETAEMPDVFAPGDFDLSGFAVGVLELSRSIGTVTVSAGDVVLGLASTGIHSNGFSLVRRIVKEAGLDLGAPAPELAPGHEGPPPTLGEVLLTPTRIYARSIVKLLRAYKVKRIVTGMAHITGGGLADNLERALGPGVDAVISPDSWEVPPVFEFLREHGRVEEEEMRRVFNMGIGYVVIVRPTFAEAAAARLTRAGERVWTIGKVVKGKGRVRLR